MTCTTQLIKLKNYLNKFNEVEKCELYMKNDIKKNYYSGVYSYEQLERRNKLMSCIIKTFNKLKIVLYQQHDAELIKFYHEWKNLSKIIINIDPINERLVLFHIQYLKKLRDYRKQSYVERYLNTPTQLVRPDTTIDFEDFVDVDNDLPDFPPTKIKTFHKRDETVLFNKKKDKKQLYTTLRREKGRIGNVRDIPKTRNNKYTDHSILSFEDGFEEESDQEYYYHCVEDEEKRHNAMINCGFYSLQDFSPEYVARAEDHGCYYPPNHHQRHY